MARRRTLGISAKLSLLSLTFAVPVAYLMWLLIGQQQIAIDFATREVVGARALGVVMPAQAAAAHATLAHQPATGVAATLRARQSDIADDLGLQQAFDTTATAFEHAGDASAVSQARGKLRDLIGQIGDRSNLILDNVLDTYYLTDVVLNRLPEVIDRVADLGAAGSAAKDAQAKSEFLVAAGALRGAIDGMDASLAAAEHDNADQSIAAAVQGSYQPLRAGLGHFLDGISSGANQSEAAGPLVTDLAAFGDRATGALDRLLGNRVAALSWNRRVHVAVPGLLYVASLLLVLWMMRRGVSQRIGRLTAATTRLAAGELSVEIPAVTSGDEVGALAAALSVFKQSMMQAERLTAERAAVQQRGDAEKRAALIGMAERIETESGAVMESVATRTAAIAASADDMSESAGRTRGSAEAAGNAAAQALANAQTVASAAEQLSASIREIGGQVAQSATVVGRAVATGGETRATMEALNMQVGRIGAVAGMISEIAAKTNLLALNATIEAARAGDAGKGFAVVASEVKQLANQTARSTDEITRHIQEVRAATDTSVAAVGRMEQTIGEVSAIADSIAAAVEQQGAATAEIARNVSETAAAANEVTRCIGQVSTEAEHTGACSARVLEDTKALDGMVRELRTSLVRVVRTSTAEVDRRQHARSAVDLGCRVTVSGQGTQHARVVDLSAGGASVRGGAVLAVGTRGTLEVDGVGMRLAFSVRSADDGTMHLAFDLDAASAERLAQMLGQLGLSGAA